MQEPLQEMNSSSLAFAEELYLEYLNDPDSVPEAWRTYFEEQPKNGLVGRKSLAPSFGTFSVFNPPGARLFPRKPTPTCNTRWGC